ncbi:hypothetical protein GQ53DRAFT_835048 [Thozetella sp. PMI_491]|nr:hypothetical protein GQ53DRAFT_835048 [Thozetella sp. PMI_491]
MAMPSGSSCDPVEIFRSACQHFKLSLSETQRQVFKEYPDAYSMLEALKHHFATHPLQTSIITRWWKKISALSDRLSPFFSVLDLLVSSHPEFAAIAWGSIRLIFVLGTRHTLFLERICELFELMGSKLVVYERFLTGLHTRRIRRGAHGIDSLVTAMGYVYADLLQFCFDVCQFLSRKRSSNLSLNGSFLRSLSLTLSNPFTVKFDTLIKRWTHHQKLLELELSVVSNAECTDALADIREMLGKFAVRGIFEEKGEHPVRNAEDIAARLQGWINALTWVDLFEHAQDRRSSDSTEWFVRHDKISRWICQDRDRAVLSVQGKPGYGKTTLCTTLIEHLQKFIDSSNFNRPGNSKVAVAFFYFDKQSPEKTSSSAAWRAILTQLLDTLADFDSDILDIFLLLREDRQSSKYLRSGQRTASDNEVFAALALLAQRLDRLFLVIDGLDECRDQPLFLDRLMNIYNGPTIVSVVIFSRPTVTLPSHLENTTVLALDTGFNLEDIKSFLQPKLSGLVSRDLLPKSYHLEEILNSVAVRASGMFLWAVLFIEYLQSPHLSVRERRNAIENQNRLSGLDSLYQAILTSLVNSHQGAWGTAKRTFEFVVCAARPLHNRELQYATATPLDRKLDPEDIIEDFPQKLGVLTEALMELDRDGFVRFVHLSVIEYLTDLRIPPNDNVLRHTKVDRYHGRQALACACLSYIYHSVDAGPLAGGKGVIPEWSIVDRQYPLLNYATEFWSTHLLECLEAGGTSCGNSDSDILIKLATAFLSKIPSVTVWIEASWVFKRPPQVRNGPHDVFFKRGVSAAPQLNGQPNSTWVIARVALHRLARDLSAMNNSWAHVLLNEPNEIWEPSISAFNSSPFWQRTCGADIAATFEAHSDENWQPVYVKSKISSDRHRIGIIRLYIPRLGNEKPAVFFELWSVRLNEKMCEVAIDVPRSCLKPFISSRGVERRFQFPSAIDADLTRIAVPGCVVHIEGCNIAEDSATLEATQFLDFTGNSRRCSWFKFGIEDFQLAYDLQMSDTREFLITVHKSNGLVEVRSNLHVALRLITVYQDTSFQSSTTPRYRCVASLAIKPAYNYKEDSDGEYGVLLHPRSAVLAIKHGGIVDQPDFDAVIQILDLFDLTTTGNSSVDLSVAHPGQEDQCQHVEVSLPVRGTQPNLQNLGEVSSFVDGSGFRAVSQLQDSGNGGIVLATLREDGIIKAEMVTRLPEQISNDYDASLLSTSEQHDENIHRIYLTPPDRPFMRFQVPSRKNRDDSSLTFDSPMVIHRARNTVPTIIGHGQYMLGEDICFAEPPRKRLPYFEEDRNPKRQMLHSKEDSNLNKYSVYRRLYAAHWLTKTIARDQF